MIFCDPQEVNDVWAIIAKGTLKDELGTAAKVAPDSGEERQHRLICVYTKDFTDMKDVTRIAAKLKEYGMIGGRGIYYKCGEYILPSSLVFCSNRTDICGRCVHIFGTRFGE